MKKIICMILAILMALAMFAGCGRVNDNGEQTDKNTDSAAADTADSSSSSEGLSAPAELKKAEDLHIVYVTPLLASDVWLVSKEGFDAAAAEYGFKGDWVGPANIDVDSMIKQIEIAIGEEADGIITCGLNPEAMVNVMETANNAGIPVVLVNAGSTMDAPYFAYIGTNAVNLGEMAAEEVVAVQGEDEINVVYVGGTITNTSYTDTVEGYKSVLEGMSNYQELSMEEDNDDVATAVDLWNNLFTAYPEITVCASASPSGAIGAAKVAAELGISDKVTIMSMDDTAEVLDLIRAGQIHGTMSQNYYRMGWQASQWIVEYWTEGKMPESKINDSGTVLVTADNVDTFGETLRDMDSWK